MPPIISVPSDDVFADIRDLLRRIRARMGDEFTCGVGWDGQYLSVSIAKPPGTQRPWVMRFDCEADYAIDPRSIIDELTTGAKAYFGSPVDQAAEIERLLKKVAEKA